MWLEEIFKGGAEGLLSGVSGIVKTLKADPTEALKLEHELAMAKMNMDTALAQAQTKINEIEAANTNLFVSGWRPFVGWVCGASFAYAVIFNDFFNWIAAVGGLPAFPEPDTTLTLEILMGLLGMAGYRSYEKVKGVAK